MRAPHSPAAVSGTTNPAETEPGGGAWGRSQPEIAMPRPKRNWNSHQLRLRALPHVARLHREEPFPEADKAEWHTAAARIAGPAGWHSVAGMRGDWNCKLIHFATQAEAETMQRWIAESGIETRPAPERYAGPQLGVAGAKPS